MNDASVISWRLDSSRSIVNSVSRSPRSGGYGNRETRNSSFMAGAGSRSREAAADQLGRAGHGVDVHELVDVEPDAELLLEPEHDVHVHERVPVHEVGERGRGE